MSRWTALLALTLAACGAAEPARDPFTATGELIALSGGDGGVENACFTCHGARGEGDGALVPRLAGLDLGYLQKQLQDYATHRRADPVMVPVSRRLSAEDRRKVAAYYAALPATGAAGPPAPAGTYARDCAACHGADGLGIGANPAIAGQPAGYVAEQLWRWKRAERRNDPRQAMFEVSRRLDGAQIAALSAYVAGLPAGASPASPAPEPSPSARRADGRNDGTAPPPRAAGSAPAG